MSSKQESSSSVPSAPTQNSVPSAPSKSSVMDDVYTGTSIFGTGVAYYTVLVGSLLGIFMISYGIYLFYKHDKGVQQLATISATNPSPCANGGNGNYSCTLDLEYTANDGQTYNEPLDYTGSVEYKKGDTIHIYVDSVNPTHISFSKKDFSPWFPIGFGIIILIIVWINLWLTKRYKAYSAVEGVVGGVNILKSL